MQVDQVRAPLASGDAALRAMFAARKQVFIDLLKWDLPALAGTYEIDQYDDPDAEYLILLDPDGNHRASARLLQTDRPHLLSDHYSYLCDGPLPSGPSVREITRFCLDRNQTADLRQSARNQLVTALAEHALANNITDYIGVAELGWLRQIITFGWDCVPLGAATSEKAKHLAALHIRINERTIAGLTRAGIHESVALHLTSGREQVA